MTDWVVAVDNSFSILVQAGQDVWDVVGEEPDHFIDLAVSMEFTVPNLEGDPKYSKREPKGDPILFKKGT